MLGARYVAIGGATASSSPSQSDADAEPEQSCRARAAGEILARALLLLSPLVLLAGSTWLSGAPRPTAAPPAFRRPEAEVELYKKAPAPWADDDEEQKPAKPTCMCLFDVDRTLTGKQGQSEHCSGTREVPGVDDTAFGGGPLVLSDLARNLDKTFCGSCYRGIITVGPVSGAGSAERAQLLEALGGPEWTLGGQWSWAHEVSSLLVSGAADEHKQETARKIVDWARKQGADVADEEVYFFDDNVLNPPPFAGSGFNARQVSCQSREHHTLIGWCGGLASEVVRKRGVTSCDGSWASSE